MIRAIVSHIGGLESKRQKKIAVNMLHEALGARSGDKGDFDFDCETLQNRGSQVHFGVV